MDHCFTEMLLISLSEPLGHLTWGFNTGFPQAPAHPPPRSCPGEPLLFNILFVVLLHVLPPVWNYITTNLICSTTTNWVKDKPAVVTNWS